MSRFVPSKSSTSTNALPPISLPPMPAKLRQISPELEEWEQKANAALQHQFRLLEEKLNAVIDTQKTGS